MSVVCHRCETSLQAQKVFRSKGDASLCYACARKELHENMDADRKKINSAIARGLKKEYLSMDKQMAEQSGTAANKNKIPGANMPPLPNVEELKMHENGDDAKEVAHLLNRLVRERSRLKNRISVLEQELSSLRAEMENGIQEKNIPVVSRASASVSQREASRSSAKLNIESIWERSCAGSRSAANEAAHKNKTEVKTKLSLVPLAEGSQDGSGFINGGRD